MKVAQQISPGKLGGMRPNSASYQLGKLEEALKNKPFIIMNVDKNDKTK